MAWIILILGVALWSAAHLFRRLAPARRDAMGNAGRGVMTVLLLLSVGLMIWGYRGTDHIHVWSPPVFLTHLNNLLMLIALYLYAADAVKAKAAVAMRHPQLIGFKTWAVAHLLVNGDLASVILFGGLLAWAVVAVIMINRSAPRPARPAWGGVQAEVIALVGALVALAVVGWIHNWLGYWPYG